MVSRIGENAGVHIANMVGEFLREENILEAEVYTETITAPAINGTATLSEGPLVEDNLTLTSGVGNVTTYVHGADYLEDPATIPGRFTNLAIPAGTTLEAEYFVPAGKDAEVSAESWRSVQLLGTWTALNTVNVYREGSRAYLRGVISGGETAAGAELVKMRADHAPGQTARLSTMTDNGPAVLEVHPGGKITIYPGPFEPGNDWLSLDGLNWPWQSPVFIHWGQEDIYFGAEELDVTYAELD